MRPLSFIIATALAWACAVSSMAILLPLYIWPSGDVWDPVYDAIASHPNIPFYVIINPSSGPGDSGRSPAISISASSPIWLRRYSCLLTRIFCRISGV
jgi:hypothetical protein